MSVPAGPVPLMPNKLWSLIARALWPQPDSSIAWAIVTAAGMPYRLGMAMAPGAIWLMNSCWAAVPGTCVASADGTFLVYDGPDGAGELGCEPAAGACSPGITAVPAAWEAREPCRAWDPCRAFDPCRAGDPCRAFDPCRAWDPCRAFDPCRAWDPPCAPALAGAAPSPAPVVVLPVPPAKSAIAPGIATMLCVPRLPGRPAVPTILVVPSEG